MNSRWGEIFRTRPDRPWDPPSLHNGHRVPYLVVKQSGRGVDHPPPSSAEVKEKPEPYFSPSGLSWPFSGLKWLDSFMFLPPYLRRNGWRMREKALKSLDEPPTRYPILEPRRTVMYDKEGQINMLQCLLTASQYYTICGLTCWIALLSLHIELQLEGNICIRSLPPHCKCVDFGT